MATWRAKCWLGSETGYQYLEVQSETLNGAYVQFENIYGVTDPINVEEIGGGYSGGSSGLGGLAVLAIGGWLAWEAWKFGSAIVMGAWKWFVGLFPFMTPQLFVGLVLGFFFLVLILAALED
tara:strand:- start:196 stop:561 length:366 start_codon:yes stop_codon:yes gene_type:complete